MVIILNKQTAFINARIYDFNDYIESGFIIFDQTIKKVGPMKDFELNDNLEIVDMADHLIMPGLILGHTHVYSTFARGWANHYQYRNFMDILKGQWWRLDQYLQKDTIFYSGIISAVDHVKNGITTMIDHHASGLIEGSLDTLKEAITDTVGLRGIYAFETSDRFDVQQAIQENLTFMKTPSNKHAGLFGLHASLSLSDQTLKKVKESLGERPIHIHVAESELDQTDCLEKYGMRVIERLDHFGLIHQNAILVHALFIDDKEAKIIKKRGATVALNPSSNMNNGVGIPDYPRLKKHGIPVMVGNDGLGPALTTEWMNLFYTTHLKKHHPMAFGLDDLKRVINHSYQYASALLGVKLGRLKPGYEADLLALPYHPPTPIDKDNALGHLMFGCFQAFKPSDVYIQGRPIVKDYTIDETIMEKYQAGKTYAQKHWNRTSKKEATS